MKFEEKWLYRNSMNSIAHVDRECSQPCREITEEEATRHMKILEMIGAKRHETATQIFYETILDCRHSIEYIFYK